MMRQEYVARIILFLLMAAAGLGGVLFLGPPAGAQSDYEIHARMPENGGWSFETLSARVGEPLRLRLTSDDVLHSFAIGKSDAEPLDLHPGEWVETELVFDHPGRYTFYCTRWCGRNHWRMRGVIEVSGSGQSLDQEVEKPLYLELGLDVDAAHPAQAVPVNPPSSQRGSGLINRMPAWALDHQTILAASPSDLFLRLRSEPDLRDLSEEALWDVVAYLYTRQVRESDLERAKNLYATNCAACHGENGQGDGVMVDGLPAFDHTQGQMGLSRPPDFTDPYILLGASPALLEGKLLRGGMGTGMPYWGPIFTGEEMDAVLAYLYTFALESSHGGEGLPAVPQSDH